MSSLTFPNESSAYRSARRELLAAEAGLLTEIERVAALRRALPEGGEPPEDYAFRSLGSTGVTTVRLSDLFGTHDTLLVYNFMYGPTMDAACPSCTSILDALDGQIPDIEQRIATAVVARHEPNILESFAAERGWQNHRLVSSAGNDFNVDYHAEIDGGQLTMAHVFQRRNGRIRHFWSTELVHEPFIEGGETRHADLFWPLWGVLDLTPAGRGDFHPALSYGGE